MIIGIVIVIVGLTFLLQSLGYIPGSAWQIIWPSLLIVIGLGIIAKRSRGCCGHHHRHGEKCECETEKK